MSKVRQTGNGATQERLFKYDSLSRLTHEKQVEATASLNDLGVKVSSGGLWTGVYKYDVQGLLQEGTDARGVKTNFTYDGLNRLKTVVYSSETGYQTPSVTYTYDEERANYYNKGRLTKVQTAANVGQGTPETIQVYDFDKVGQVVNHTQSIGNQSYNLQYGYNLASQLVSEKYPSGKIMNFTVDNSGVLQTVSDAGRTYLSGISLNNQGLLSQINLGNGTSETFSYNDRFQMTSQNLLKGAEVLQKYDYSYGQVDLASGNVDLSKNNGQLGKIESFIGANKQWSQRFGYDELGRLSEAREYKAGDNTQLSYKQKFDFDRFGNLYRKNISNPTSGQQNPLPYTPIEDGDISKATNRFTSQTGTVYDEAGQVVTDNKFRNINFAYDANGRQVKASKTNVPDAWTVYDALGNRVATKINEVWQYVIYDAFGKLVAEYGIASEGLGGVKYVQQDWQGSVRAVTNNSGFVVARTDHQAFGEEIGLGVGLRSLEQGYSADKTTRQGYGLTEKDESSGQQHTWFRKLETKAGRWTSPDPYNGSMRLGNPQSFNRYSYVKNQPTNYVDPSGLDDDFWNTIYATAQGIAEARGALNSSLCRNFLARGGSFGNRDPRAIFSAYLTQGLIGVGKKYDNFGSVTRFRDGNIGAVTTLGYTAGRGLRDGQLTVSASQITINQNGFFFSLRTTTGVSVSTLSEFSGLTSAQIRGAVILHELAHAFGAIPSDGNNSAQSRANSSAIKLFCFSKIADYFNPTKQVPVETPPGVISTGIETRPLIGYNNGGYPSWWLSLQLFLTDIGNIPLGEGSVTVCYNGQCV